MLSKRYAELLSFTRLYTADRDKIYLFMLFSQLSASEVRVTYLHVWHFYREQERLMTSPW